MLNEYLFVLDTKKTKMIKEFVNEGLQMRNLNHPNVMTLLGICWDIQASKTSSRYPPLIVLPYMELGDLKSHLKKYRLNESLRKVLANSVVLDTHLQVCFLETRHSTFSAVKVCSPDS